MATLVPILVDGETGLKALAAILRANGFALRCDLDGNTIAEPMSRGLFALVRRDDLPSHPVGVTNAC